MDGPIDPIFLNVDGRSAPAVDAHSLTPNAGRAEVDRIRGKIDQMQVWQSLHLSKTIQQFDDALARPGIAASMVAQLLEAKARALAKISENTTRLASELGKLRQAHEGKLSSTTRNRAIAARILEINRKALKDTVTSLEIQEPSPPNVFMFAVGCDFRPTVGINRIKRRPPSAIPPSKEDDLDMEPCSDGQDQE